MRDFLKEKTLEKLVKNMCWYWDDCETGAPAVDPKRPYGNSSVDTDVLELLEIAPDGDGDDKTAYSREQCDWALVLHKETLGYIKQKLGCN